MNPMRTIATLRDILFGYCVMAGAMALMGTVFGAAWISSQLGCLKPRKGRK